MTTKTFRKRPVEVQAVQWTGDNADELKAFTGTREATGEPRFLTTEEITRGPFEAHHPVVYDELHYTWVNVMADNWIIRGVQGEFYPCAADVFAKTHEEVTA